MRREIIYYLIMLSIVFIVRNSFAQNLADDYTKKKILEIILSGLKDEGNFKFTVVPLPLELLVAQQYDEWEEKRYTYDEMILKAKAVQKQYENSVHALLAIYFIGEWDSKGETSKKIPEDIAEYIFLENDKGKALRCSQAIVPLMGGTVNYINESSQIHLEFPLRLKNTNESIFKDSEKIKFVVGGLGFKDNEIEYRLPFSELFLDAPTNIKNIYYDIGIWEKRQDEKGKEEIAQEIKDQINKLEYEKKQLQNAIQEIDLKIIELRERLKSLN